MIFFDQEWTQDDNDPVWYTRNDLHLQVRTSQRGYFLTLHMDRKGKAHLEASGATFQEAKNHLDRAARGCIHNARDIRDRMQRLADALGWDFEEVCDI